MKKINLETIILIIAKKIGVDGKEININSKSTDFYRWDSLTQVTIILDIEKIINKKIIASQIGELNSVKKIIDYLKKNKVFL
tara:strand:- start:296 stop:541 length:246 start_codon:yes stop_codon:yes gene_type:complete